MTLPTASKSRPARCCLTAKEQVRVTAVRLLLSLQSTGRRLDSISRDPFFLARDRRDRRLLTELAYGVVRWRSRLDFYIDRLARRSPDKLDPAVLWILRLGLYQLEFLAVSEHAVVSEAVESCRPLRVRSAGGFVNAVLRGFLRGAPPLPAGVAAAALAIRWSHPRWLVQRYLDRYGSKRTEALLERNNRRPHRYLHVNSNEISQEELCRALESDSIEYEPCSDLPGCLRISAPNFVKHRLYREGKCFFMDRSSQEVAALTTLQPGFLVGDLCSAPGGKSFAIADREPEAHVCCSDISRYRLEELRSRIEHYSFEKRMICIQADVSRAAPFGRVFDRVLLDVPCSGLGTLRSNPDIKWRLREGDLLRQQLRQRAILRSGFSTLKRDGELIYSTCSTEPEENEGVIDPFLEEMAEARIERPYLRTFPDGPADGFFAAVIRHC